MDANIVQGCDEVGTVEAEEQDVEVRTVLRLIWWTETAQNSAAAAPSPALLRRWGRSLTQDGGDLHLPPTLQLALLLTLFRVHAVLLGFAAGTLHRHGEWDAVPPPQVGTASDLHLLAVPPLLVHTFDLQQQTLQHLGQELAGDVLACVQQTFRCFRHRRMLATDAR